MADKTIAVAEGKLKDLVSSYDDSVSKPTSSETTMTKLTGYFGEIKDSVKALTSNYSTLVSYKRKIEEAYVVAAVYQLYGTLFKGKIEAFNQLTILAEEIKDGSSYLNSYLAVIDKALGIYYSDSTSDEKSVAKRQIDEAISKIKGYIKTLLEGLRFIPSGLTVDSSSVNDDGTSPIKSSDSRSFQSSGDRSEYSVFMADMTVAGLVAEKSTAYIKIKASDNVASASSATAYVSVPLSGLLNQEFSLSKYQFLLFWQMPNYVAAYEADNDGSDSKVTSEKVEKTSVIRLGGVFSQTNVFADGTPIKYKYDSSSSSWSTGSVKSVGTFVDEGMTLVCGFSGSEKDRSAYAKSYRLSDSVKAVFLAKMDGAEYSVSGTLDYDRSKSEEKMDRSVYTGTIGLKSSDQTVSRPVILEIKPDSGSYSVSLKLDPSSSVNSSSAISDSVLDASNLVPIMMSREYSGVQMSEDVPTTETTMKTAQAMESIGSLTTDDMGVFSDRYSRLRSLLKTCASGIDEAVSDSLLGMASVGKTATSAIAVLQRNDPNYDASGYASDVETAFATMESKAETYSSESSSSTDSIYDGTAYSKLLSCHDEFSGKMRDVLSDLRYGNERLDDLESRVLMVADSEAKDADFSSTLTLFSNIITGVSSTVEAYIASGTEFVKIQIDPYSAWMKAWKSSGASSSKASLSEYAYLLSAVKRHDSDNGTDSEGTSDSWLESFNWLIGKLASEFGRKIGNPLSFKDEVPTMMDGKDDIALKTGFAYSSTPNSFYIHPMLTKRFPALSGFDSVDVEEMLGTAKTLNSAFFDSWKQIAYSALISESDLGGALSEMAGMLIGRKLNIREACLAVTISETMSSISSDQKLHAAFGSRDMSDWIGSLGGWRAVIGEYSDVYRIYANASDDMAETLMSAGSSSLSLLERGTQED